MMKNSIRLESDSWFELISGYDFNNAGLKGSYNSFNCMSQLSCLSKCRNDNQCVLARFALNQCRFFKFILSDFLISTNVKFLFIKTHKKYYKIQFISNFRVGR